MICSQCGISHPLDEMELSFRRPEAAAILSEEERAARLQENRDLCIIDGAQFFVRAVLPIPVRGRDRGYNVGVWVEVSQSSFERIYELWDDPDQDKNPPFQATLANSIPTLPETIGIPGELRLSSPSSRPTISVLPALHPLHSEQVGGISPHRAHEYSSIFA